MIELTRLNGERFFLNVFLIKQIQSFPDTTITLTDGSKLVVKTKEEAVVQKIMACYQQIGLMGKSHFSVIDDE